MALCRIKNPEQLKQYAPSELGKLLGLDCVLEVGTFRKKLQQIIGQSKADDIHQALFHSWVEKMPESFFILMDMFGFTMVIWPLCQSVSYPEKNLFKPYAVSVFETDVTMHLYEQQTELSGCWFREVRKCSEDYQQTSIITINPSLLLEVIARKMFARWTQENYFKYMIDNFDFDRMIEYGTQPVEQSLKIVNTEYRQLSYQIKKAKEKKQRLEAKLLKKLEAREKEIINVALKIIAQSSELIEQINHHKTNIDVLIKKRESVAAQITVQQMPAEKRYNKLKQEGKK